MPQLTEAEALHAQQVEALVRAEVRARGGWLPFDEFMTIALYAPGLGYYSAGATKFGAAGDFVTAPEISELFGVCLATQCADILEGLGDSADILEFGPGSGRMAATVLAELARRGTLPRRYRLLEVSADLRERQRAYLGLLPAALAGRMEWLERVPEEPLCGVVLANEVLDALPCERFAMLDGAIFELGVGLGARDALTERAAPARPAVAAAVQNIREGLTQHWPSAYRSELCLRVHPWIAALGSALSRGVALLFDYGLPRAHYYHPQRNLGTLQCHYRHRAHEACLWQPGLQDITAWVDFTRVAEAAASADLELLGFATQAAFLLGNGIENRLADTDNTVRHARLAGEAQRLLLPGEMGEAVKVMALGRDFDAELKGFALQDLRRSL